VLRSNIVSGITYFPGIIGHLRRGSIEFRTSENNPLLLLRNLQIAGNFKLI
jgi:hypothetical protein